ncbi:putative phosphoesterase [Nitrincola phage 1M3-16]|uniref:phosphoesterase n=1 Tax=Nitrincola phage 1M3-16 TaxID=1472912 RepID=UPI000444CD22|nr:phosphoesterase [Nitrincola phage 1M3-16]AHX01085.1 putative phosphoesterase [Nitrincola phage 1M3-16]
MSSYLVSDIHLFHKNILKFTKRPYNSLEEMHEGTVEEWNKVIKQGDIVYHLGDLSFLGMKHSQEPLYNILNSLQGTIYMLKGNHDYSDLWKAHRAAQEDGRLRRGIFFEDSPYREVKHNKKKIILCHYPIICWNGQHHGTLHAWGHSHNNLQLNLGKAMDVGWDALWENYEMKAPILMDEFIEKVDCKETVCYDHHSDIKNRRTET